MRKNKHNHLTVFVFLGICLAAFLPMFIFAQASEYSTLKKQIGDITEQTRAIQNHQDSLLRKNKEYTTRINATKLKLQRNSNPILERQLQNDLKESRALADQIQELDKRNYNLTKQSVELKKKLVILLNKEIERLTQEANTTLDNKNKLQKLQRALEFQKEKEAYYSQITQESNELLLALDVAIKKDDGPDDILRKIAIIQDQRDIIRGKIQKLDAQFQSVQKNISLQRNMLELLRDIDRGEEDELDLDRSTRIAQRQEQIADMEANLEIMKAKKEMWQARDKILAMKIEQFNKEVAKLLTPTP